MRAPLYKRDHRSGSSNPDIGVPVTLTSALFEAREIATLSLSGEDL